MGKGLLGIANDIVRDLFTGAVKKTYKAATASPATTAAVTLGGADAVYDHFAKDGTQQKALVDDVLRAGAAAAAFAGAHDINRKFLHGRRLTNVIKKNQIALNNPNLTDAAKNQINANIDKLRGMLDEKTNRTGLLKKAVVGGAIAKEGYTGIVNLALNNQKEDRNGKNYLTSGREAIMAAGKTAYDNYARRKVAYSLLHNDTNADFWKHINPGLTPFDNKGYKKQNVTEKNILTPYETATRQMFRFFNHPEQLESNTNISLFGFDRKDQEDFTQMFHGMNDEEATALRKAQEQHHIFEDKTFEVINKALDDGKAWRQQQLKKSLSKQ